MQEDHESALNEARDLARLSGQWLKLLGFQPHPASPTFSPSLSLYHDMLDPSATDTSRLAACIALKPSVLCQTQAEQRCGAMDYAQARPVDPYGIEWRTTRDGAALETIAHLLSKAIDLFDEAGITIEN